MSSFKMPEEIADAIKIFWSEYLIPGRKNYPLINDNDILVLETSIIKGFYDYSHLFHASPVEYGLTEDERLDFWIKVIRGDYNLYFQKFSKHQSIEVDGQLFIL